MHLVRRLPPAVRFGVCWVATRALVVLLTLHVLRISGLDVSSDVTVIYQGWYEVLRSGTFPLDDATWQYPPAAALVMLAPGLLPWSYLTSFLVLVALCDAAAAALLWRSDRRTGAWYWLWAVPLLGPTVYARYDLVVTVAAMAGLLALSRRPRLGGALAGLGAMLKAWPVLLLVAAPRGRRGREAATALLGSILALIFFFAVATHGAWAFLGFQENRGIEVESLGGVVFQLARAFGWSGTVSMNYGALEFLGPGVTLVADVSVALTVAAFGWLLLWRYRARTWSPATPYDAALCALLLFTLTSRVISPQYVVWLLGLAAVCLTAHGTTQRPVAALLVACAVLTTLEFPAFFGDVVNGRPLGVSVLVTRNLLLAATTVTSCRRLWQATIHQPCNHPGARGCDVEKRARETVQIAEG